jgi:ABC-2 type transport system permease protein
MKAFWSVARFEWRYQVRSPVFWIGFIIFFLLTFGATTVDTIQIGARGNVNVNSPFAIVQTMETLIVFAMFILVAMVAGTVIRDDETGFAPILRSTRITKGAYLLGRFFGSITAALAVTTSIPLAIMIGSAMPWLDPEKVGPFVLWHYVYALLVFALPTLLILGAALFALATATRSLMWTYVGAIGTVVGLVVSRSWLRDQNRDTISALTEPFGLSALSITTKYWTAFERNTMVPPLSGLLLENRLLWIAIAVVFFAIAWVIFRFETHPRSRAAKKAAAVEVEVEVEKQEPNRVAAIPAAAVGTSSPSGLAQMLALARFDMALVFRSPAFFVLLMIGCLNAMGSGWFLGSIYGSDSYPVTRLMAQALNGAFTIMPIIIAIYYGGELVWRNRERRMHEIVDATSAPDWAHLIPKIVAITLVLACTCVAAIATGVLIQVLKGYTHFQLASYVLWFGIPVLVGSVLFAILSVFIQVLVPQKFIGYGVMLVFLVASLALGSAGFEHNLYSYASTTGVPLSDFNGMARFWIGHAWFEAYWCAFALMLVVFSYALWRRGTTLALRPRVASLPRRLKGTPSAILAVAFVAWVAIGGFIFYNTNILNRYRTQPDLDRELADAEKALLPFEKLVVPRIVGVTLDVQLYPHETRAVTKGNYRIVNRSDKPIEEVHLNWAGDEVHIDLLEIDGATLAKSYDEFDDRVYRFSPALQPGETREVRFATTLEERGFPNARALTRIVDNGTFLNNSEIAPGIGISRDFFLKDRAKRRKYGLPPDLRPPTLEDESGRIRNPFSPSADWVDADITVTTDADQTPIAPGYTESDTVANGRRTVHFKPDAPINDFFSIQSARYAVRRDKQGDIDLAVYYQPGHEYNIDRILAAMKLSLSMFSERFSPYQFRQARILEFPSYATFAQSFANTIPYSEDIGFLTKLGNPDKIDIDTYVTAHEIAHQWWGHQLVPGDQQGATMLIESFAQYSALLVMEKMYGRDQIRRFLKYELDSYLRSRGGEVVEELPLARVENQPYIHYRKGSLTMYWIKEVCGEEKVDRAMSIFLKAHAFKAAPYPNSLDFLKVLREQCGPENDALITDLFEKITLLDVKAREAKATKRADGRYDVTFTVDAKKFYADGKGRETEAPLAEAFDIGVFSAEPGRPGFTSEAVLSFARQPIHTGAQTVTVTVDKAPAFVGIDPYNKRIDRNSEDNITKVVMEGGQ